MNESIKINMNGKQYIEYKKYMNDRFKIRFSKKTKEALPYFFFCFLGIIAICFLIDHLTYIPPQPIGYSNLYGVTVHNGLIIWAAACIGIAWVVHGFGFIIIKR